MNYYYYVCPVYTYMQQPIARDTENPEDVDQFKKSAVHFINRTQELNLLLHHIAYTPKYAERIKVAASYSQEEQVLNIIRSIGIQTPVRVNFNPSGINIIFEPTINEACYDLEVRLCW